MLENNLSKAAAVISDGGIIAYPTEAVWGLGCDPDNGHAVKKILDLKQRPESKGVILIAAQIDQLSEYLGGLNQAAMDKLMASWPGPVTWLVPHNGRAPSWIRGQYDSVALRVTDHKQTAELCKAYGGPIVSTSANINQMPSLKTMSEVEACFGSGIDYYLAGELGGRENPSEIRQLNNDKVWRQG